MEPFARRPIEGVSVRRPVTGGAVQRRLQPRVVTPNQPGAQPVSQPTAQPSLLKPPTIAAGSPRADIRPNTIPGNHPVQQQVQITPRPTTPHHGALHPTVQPLVTTTPAQTENIPNAPPAPQSHRPTSEADTSKPHKPNHPTAHAGLIGFIVFLIAGILCLAPLLPGKIWEGAPGSSDSFSSGDQSLDCLTSLGTVNTVTTYNHKVGFPVVYSYATTSQQSATCQGKTLHVISGHTSQFNLLGLLINLALTSVMAVASAKVWRKLRVKD